LDKLEAIAASPALAHCSSIVPLGAPLTPIPPTSSPPALMGRPPGRTANRSIAIIPGLAVLARSSIADVGDWKPAAAYALLGFALLIQILHQYSLIQVNLERKPIVIMAKPLKIIKRIWKVSVYV
jgi:hypothetical protein